MLLILDDERTIEDIIGLYKLWFYDYDAVGLLEENREKYLVNNYKKCIEFVEKNYNKITHIFLDHDLGSKNTGYDALKKIIEIYKNNNINLPRIFCHSMNSVGRDNILRSIKYV